jgi:hypothetical protein
MDEPKLPNPNNAVIYTEGIYCKGANKEIEAVIWSSLASKKHGTYVCY